jgi:hypothetical protein
MNKSVFARAMKARVRAVKYRKKKHAFGAKKQSKICSNLLRKAV